MNNNLQDNNQIGSQNPTEPNLYTDNSSTPNNNQQDSQGNTNIPSYLQDVYHHQQTQAIQANTEQKKIVEPINPSPSPEFPSTIESNQEVAVGRETGVEQISGENEQEATDIKQVPPEKKDVVEPPPHSDDSQQSVPHRVYGYKVPQSLANQSNKQSNGSVKGDPSAASTWIYVLLNKLVRLYQN